MKTLAFIALFLVTACPPKAVPGVAAPKPADLSVMLACKGPVTLKQADVCDGYFTRDGLACAVCENAKSCVDEVVVMYCASGPCVKDPNCTIAKDAWSKAKAPAKQ